MPRTDSNNDHWIEGFYGRQRELQRLISAWEATKSGKPQIVSIISESGYGKTRLAQEFYKILAQAERATNDQTYWPPSIGKPEDNLAVAPNPDECGNHDHALPFLWLGVRLPDPEGRDLALSASTVFSQTLKPHLTKYSNVFARQELQDQQKAAVIRASRATGSAILGQVPIVSNIFSILETGKELAASYQNYRSAALEIEQQEARADGAKNEKTNQNANLIDLTSHDLDIIFRRPPKGMKAIPGVIFIDDAQWIIHDQAMTQLCERIAKDARRFAWPLLIIVCSWEREWSEADEKGIRGVFLSSGLPETQINLQASVELGELVLSALPNLPDRQVDALLQKSGGNARHLVELIRELISVPRYFVDRDCAGHLNDSALSEIQSLSFEILARKRFRTSPEVVQIATGLAALQGTRFTPTTVDKAAEKLGKSRAEEGLKQADHPYAFVSLLPFNVAEFRAPVFRQIAEENLENHFDLAVARQALRDCERDGQLRILSSDEAGAVDIGLAEARAQLIYSDDPIDKILALEAISALIMVSKEENDWTTADKYTEIWIDNVPELLDSKPDLLRPWVFQQPFDIISWSKFSPGYFFSEKHQKLAKLFVRCAETRYAKSESIETTIDLAESLARVGEYFTKIDPTVAREMLRKSLNIKERIAKRPIGRERQISLASTKREFAEALEQSSPDEAIDLYGQSVDLLKSLRKKNPQKFLGSGELNLMVSLVQSANLLVKFHPDRAVSQYLEAIEIRESLNDTGDPGKLFATERMMTHAADQLEAIEVDVSISLRERALKVAALLDAEIDNPAVSRILRNALNRLAKQLLERAPHRSLELYQRVIELEKIKDPDRVDPERLRSISIAQYWMGVALHRLGKRNEAIGSHALSLAFRDKRAKILNNHEGHWDALATARDILNYWRGVGGLFTSLRFWVDFMRRVMRFTRELADIDVEKADVTALNAGKISFEEFKTKYDLQ